MRHLGKGAGRESIHRDLRHCEAHSPATNSDVHVLSLHAESPRSVQVFLSTPACMVERGIRAAHADKVRKVSLTSWHVLYLSKQFIPLYVVPPTTPAMMRTLPTRHMLMHQAHTAATIAREDHRGLDCGGGGPITSKLLTGLVRSRAKSPVARHDRYNNKE